MKLQKRQRGYSLIEILLVLGIISGALVLAFITFPKVKATSNANLESQHITLMQTQIKGVFSTAKSFNGLNNAMAIGAKIIPDDMRVAGNTINNVWDGTVTLGTDGAAALRYRITYTAVPRSECIKLGTGVSTNFLRLDIEGTTIFDRRTNLSVDIDPVAITAACADAGSTMIFYGN